jgi:uncharacterized protein (DUF1499 family)
MAFLSFLAGILGVLGVAGAYFRYLSPFLGFYLVLGAFVVIALNFPINLVRFVKKGRRNLSYGGLLFGLIAVAGLGVLLKFAIENPVTDVTNSASAPPQFRVPASTISVPAGMQEFVDPNYEINRDYDPSSFEKQTRAYPNIYVLDMPAQPAEAFALAEAVIAKNPQWRKVLVDKTAGSIEMQEELPIFHSVDDFLVQVLGSPSGSILLLRSRSRFGFTDFGFNAKRIRKFTDEYVAAASALTPPLKVEFRK